jgi:hypothetical protein
VRSLTKKSSTGGSVRGQLKLLTLSVVAALLVPAAIAWACNPQAYLRLDKPGYTAGEQMAVSGAFFKGNRKLTLSFEPSGTGGSVTTTSNGFFATKLTAPSAPGSYTLSAVGYEADGSVTTGLPARISFDVSASAADQPGSQPGATQPGSQPGATQPGSRPQPGAKQPSPGKSVQPKERRGRSFSSPGSRPSRGRTPGTRARGGTGAANAGDGVIDTSNGAVFAGSVAREDRGALASRSGQSGAAKPQGRGTQGAGAASERSASGDVWSGFGSAKAPSLNPGATDPAVSQDAGSQLGWGLGLLALGLLALVGGLTAEARRRRAVAD